MLDGYDIAKEYSRELVSSRKIQELHEWTDEDLCKAILIANKIRNVMRIYATSPPLAILAGLQTFYICETQITKDERKGQIADEVINDINRRLTT